MSLTRFFLCLLFLLSLSAQTFAVTTLWTKTLPREIGFRFTVGSDGTVGIVDGAHRDVRKIYWIDRSGNMLREIDPPSPDSPFVPHYVSRDELIVAGTPSIGMSLYQFVGDDQVTYTHIPQGLTAFFNDLPVSYPYFLVERKLEDGYSEFTLLDLTNPNSLRIVGDAVIGVHGKNLKVRWKSVVNAKYKVQYSLDLDTWIDYTEAMDGTGATLIVNVPIEEDASSLYARVLKL